MHEKRYQDFISSTFEDLKAERRAIQDVVISTGDFPVQMESFPAADEDQFEFIKSLIDQCDYYVLVIAGRYGSVSDDGLSYTHKEFRYAVSKNVPVLVMLHGDRGNIIDEKSGQTDAGKQLLRDFITEAERGRLRKTWTTLDGLKLAVREALDYAKHTIPRVGWMRGDAVASLDALEELNSVRKENEDYRAMLGELEAEVSLPEIPTSTSELVFDLLPLPYNGFGGGGSTGTQARIKTSWISVFPAFYANLDWSQYNDGYGIDDEASCLAIGSTIASEIGRIDATNLYSIQKHTLERLKSYYIEAGLMKQDGDVPFSEVAQKVARRHLIGGHAFDTGEVISGEIKLIDRNSKGPMDDEIPF